MEVKRFPACLKCGQPGVGFKPIICQKCVAELFGNNGQTIAFCRKCQRSRPLTDQEKERAVKLAQVHLSKMADKKIILVLDSCPQCYQAGDSRLGQFAALTLLPEA